METTSRTTASSCRNRLTQTVGIALFWGVSVLYAPRTLAQTSSTSDRNPRCDRGCARNPPRSLDEPYVISPRRTLVFSNSLLLRWFAVEGATTYRVRVAGAGVNWETLVSEPFAIYEGTLLQPGQMYLVSVDADNGTASSTTVFSTVNEAQRTQIQQQLDLLDAMALDDSQRAISEARIYADSGAMADAIEVLEAQVRAGSDNAEVYCLLASLYQQHYGTLDLADLYTELLNQVDRLGETCTTP